MSTFLAHPGARDPHCTPPIGHLPQLGIPMGHHGARDPHLGNTQRLAPPGWEPPVGHPQAGDPSPGGRARSEGAALGGALGQPGVSGAAVGGAWGHTRSSGAAGGWTGGGWGNTGGLVPHIQGHLSPQFMLATDKFQLGYTEGGHCLGEPNTLLAPPQRLQWDISQEVGLTPHPGPAGRLSGSPCTPQHWGGLSAPQPPQCPTASVQRCPWLCSGLGLSRWCPPAPGDGGGGGGVRGSVL